MNPEDDRDLDLKPPSLKDLRRIATVVKVTQRVTAKSNLDIARWSTYTTLRQRLSEAIAAATYDVQRASLQALTDNCRTAISQYEQRIAKQPDGTERETNIDKKLRIEALQYAVLNLYDAINPNPRKMAKTFQSFLMERLLTDIEQLSAQLEVQISSVKLKKKLVEPLLGLRRTRAEENLQEMRHQAKDLVSDLMKKQIAFGVGIELLDEIQALYTQEEEPPRHTLAGTLTRKTQKMRAIGKTGKLE